jgi:hypothetical protein
MRSLPALITIAALGCSGGTSASSVPDGGFGPKMYEEVLGYDWSLTPGLETYFCVYKTLSEDLWVSDFRSEFPAGTHHVTLGFSDPGPPDGVVASTDTAANPPCDGVTLGNNLLYFSGVGTGEMHLPSGVATKVPAGKQLVFSLHLLNPSSAPLTGHSGVQVVHAVPSSVVHEAEVIAAGKFQGLSVPPKTSIQNGTCTMTGPVTLFAVAPHMHLMGVHLTTTIQHAGGGTTTLFDKAYQFEQQAYTFVDPPLPLTTGDTMQVACSYDNTGSTTLTFGESTTQNEMCIMFTYRYPAIATNLVCQQ